MSLIGLAPQGLSAIIWASVTIGLATLAVGLRFWARHMGARLAADDWTILVALLICWVFYVLCNRGNLTHQAHISLDEASPPELKKFLLVSLDNECRYRGLMGEIN